MSRDDLGQVAYEARYRAHEDWDTNTFVTWDTLPERNRRAWRIGAEAVRQAVLADQTEYVRRLEALAAAEAKHVRDDCDCETCRLTRAVTAHPSWQQRGQGREPSPA